jgi:white-opaque regulator 2
VTRSQRSQSGSLRQQLFFLRPRGLHIKTSADDSPGGPIKVDQLFWIGGLSPPEVPAAPAPLDQNAMNEIRNMYINEFAPGLNSFFETRWYSSAGVEKLMTDSEMCQFMSELIKRYKAVGTGNDYTQETVCRVLETKAVWKLASMCRSHPPAANGANGIASLQNLELEELNKRLDIIEHLLTKSTALSNPVNALRYPENLPEEIQSALQFWRIVGDFVSLKLDDNANGLKFDSILIDCRNNLNRLENRDVIYSILVTRHVGRRVPGFPDRIQATDPRAGESDDTNRVALAKEFIVSEASWKGTTHPIQRLCDMAIRSWALR